MDKEGSALRCQSPPAAPVGTRPQLPQLLAWDDGRPHTVRSGIGDLMVKSVCEVSRHRWSARREVMCG
jgi:hypothetical protein